MVFRQRKLDLPMQGSISRIADRPDCREAVDRAAQYDNDKAGVA
jgi:hypothetical protein